ncbi:MAG: aminopeptidase P family protein [Polyangiaceae bacterium]|nr:aminopeptidase P family protein [Polyangiaceae bacterium]
MADGFPRTESESFANRRKALAALLEGRAALLAAGAPSPRNYPANAYPFRASSHFLYLVGRAIPGAFVLVEAGGSTLFAEPPDRDDAIWHGPRPSLDELRAQLGIERVEPLADLEARLRGRADLATLPPQDHHTARTLAELCGRTVLAGSGAKLTDERDVALAEAMIAIRLAHDEAAKAQLRAAAQASAVAHVAGMRATKHAKGEAEVCAAITAELRRRGMDDAYGPIVTVHGEILHAHGHEGALTPGDLLLCDVGGESHEGWASDITRTWPVTGRFSATQRAIYDVVLDANRRAIDKVRPGVSYRDAHETAKRAIVEGLVSLGILRGDVDGLLERGAANVFFPHGVGHLLGLDVHDMEDLGDRAGYAPGRTRSARFGDRYLRLDRDLVPGMAVTIEPGFYQVPGILADEALVGPLGADLDRGILAKYADVRGIRIEDDVLCTNGDPEVMTASCPKRAEEIEALMA